jgi:hypothetical protein
MIIMIYNNNNNNNNNNNTNSIKLKMLTKYILHTNDDLYEKYFFYGVIYIWDV